MAVAHTQSDRNKAINRVSLLLVSHPPLPVSRGLLVGGHSPLFTPRELRLELSIVRVGGVFPFGSRWGLAPGILVLGACPHYSGHAPQRVVAYCLISGPKLMVY